MYYVYVLKDPNTNELYYGYTSDLKRRWGEHQTKEHWQLVYYEAYHSERDARAREQHLKHYGQARTHLKKRLTGSLGAAN